MGLKVNYSANNNVQLIKNTCSILLLESRVVARNLVVT